MKKNYIKYTKKYASIIRILGFICIISTFNYMGIIDYSNISLYVIIALVYALYKHVGDIKADNITRVFAVIFSIMMTFGYYAEHDLINGAYMIAIQFIGWYSLFIRLLILFEKQTIKLKITNSNKKISSVKFILVSMLFGFICLLPYLLLYFPAVMTMDSYSQGSQVMGMLRYSNHHPWIHTMLIKLFYEIGYSITGNKTIGISFYTVFQMLTMCFIYSYTVYILYKNNVKKVLLILLWAFFFINPFNAIYSITMWKDVLFSGITLLFTVFLWDHYHNNKNWNIKTKIAFVVLGTSISAAA